MVDLPAEAATADLLVYHLAAVMVRLLPVATALRPAADTARLLRASVARPAWAAR